MSYAKNKIKRAILFLHPIEGTVFELTVMKPTKSESQYWEGWAKPSGGIVTGYFTSARQAARLAHRIDKEAEPEGIYITINSINKQKQAAADSQLKAGVSRTADSDIVSIDNLLIDIDPVRPTGTSSSAEQHDAATKLAMDIKKDLEVNHGWPKPLRSDSGNGGHLIYKLEGLPNNDETQDLIGSVLEAMAARFDMEDLKIDRAVGNPARLTKLYGTWVRKGDDMEDYPHRQSRIIHRPRQPEVVTKDMLKALVDASTSDSEIPKDNDGRAKNVNRIQQTDKRGPGVDLAKFLTLHDVKVRNVKRHGESTLYVLEECLFNPDHNNGEAAVGQMDNGALFYKCFHDSCSDKKWADAKEAIMAKKIKPQEPPNAMTPTVTADALSNDEIDRAASPLPEPPVKSDSKEEWFSYFNTRHAVIVIGGKTWILNEDFDWNFHRKTISFSKVKDFTDRYSNGTVTIEGKEVPVAPLWFKSKNRRYYDGGVIFDPEKDHPGCYNLWRGFAVEPKEGEIKRFLRHTRRIICAGDKKLFEWVLDWMADAVQNPSNKPGTAIVLQGKQGTGKGLWVRYFSQLFGPHFLHVASSRYITGNFNDHLRDALVVFADEAFFAGDKQSLGDLKALVTEEVTIIEKKYHDAYQAKNMVRLIMASNNDWVVSAGLEERRFAVLEVSDMKMQNKKYFSRLAAEMENGGHEALLHFLMNREIKSELRQIPKTKALIKQKLISMTPVQKFWFNRLVEGLVLPAQDNWEREVEVWKVMACYWNEAQRSGARHRSETTSLGIELHKLIPGLKTVKRMGDKEPDTPGDELEEGRVRKYQLPPLEKCRAGFLAVLNMDLDWDEVQPVPIAKVKAGKTGKVGKKYKKGKNKMAHRKKNSTRAMEWEDIDNDI